MLKWISAALLVVFVSVATGTAALPRTDTAFANEAPLADAGLDQDVTKGATVLLDGTGSRDPDGRIRHYRWSIRTPDGNEITPDCPDCARTRFTPTETGRYRVTLTVTDDNGAESSDTLYVVVSPGTDPSISLSGPTRPTAGSTVNLTADLDAGAAALDYVVWTVDGTPFANHTLSADQRSDTVARRFPTAGERTITATVYDVDGQSDTASLGISVTPEPDTPPTWRERDPNSSTAIAERAAPVVDGDTVVTGTRPLQGRYDVRLDVSSASVRSVTWRNTSTRIGTGTTLRRSWEPGEHELYAVVTYVDGSQNVATFADGSTTVVADPAPNVSVESLERFGSISGTVGGSDGYENLELVRVEVAGETVATTESRARQQYRSRTGARQLLSFWHYDFTPGKRYRVTVVAIDERGQTTRTSRYIEPVKEPEIVRSEFVNGPVDSYHERIDPSRYKAHHVLKIDLNGVDKGNATVNLRHSSKNLIKLSQEKKFSEQKSQLIVYSSWGGQIPKHYHPRMVFDTKFEQVDWDGSNISSFQVTPSKPELRLDVINDGTKEYITRDHGILVNASSSFDPDKTDLKYIWKYGATPTKPDNTTAKFRAYERAASIIEDGYDLQTKRNFDFLNYFIPEISSKEVVTEGPYYPGDEVRLRVKTDAYHLSKQTYYDDLQIGISTSLPKADVVKWETVKAPDSEHSEPTEYARRYVGIVEIPASALVEQRPTVTVYNKENRRKESEVSFPAVSVLVKDGHYWSDPTVTDLTYHIEKKRTRKVTVESREERDRYISQGYDLEEREYKPEFVLERRVQVQDAKYETVTRNFSSKRIRDIFLASEWTASGTNLREVTRTETETHWRDSVQSKWRDSNLWNGEFTGDTRQVVDPAKYRTDKQYEYEQEVEKTDTRTDWETRTVTVTHTGTHTVTRCHGTFACTEVTETYTYETYETYRYPTTETYTYTVTQTKTYWSPFPTDPHHHFTGKTRRVKVEEETQKTQYEIAEKNRHTSLVTLYEAERQKQVSPAKYEWKVASTTDDRMSAIRKANSNDGVRLGRARNKTIWVLNKTEVDQFEAPNYENAENVVRTSGTVSGVLVERYFNPRTGEWTMKRIPEQTEVFTYNGAVDRQEIQLNLQGINQGENSCKHNSTCDI
ncbi:PKD domain-containing protein [Halorussus sp. AFM4]|uniref:PKD domain-containing protein n=1 Tax=Halorussus sp. AFM4 TaxID=3421651 RepID=UPI003EB836BD